MWAKNKQGFTIVELLIVVVVIAILAAITIVTYTGIQDRAQRSQVASAVNSWEKILQLYVSNGGETMPFGEGTCLSASPNDFPAGDGFQAGRCGTDSSEVDPYYIGQFKEKSVAQIPSTVLTPVAYNGYKYRGMYAQSMGGLILVYFVKGTTCLKSSDNATVVGNATQCVRNIQLSS